MLLSITFDANLYYHAIEYTRTKSHSDTTKGVVKYHVSILRQDLEGTRMNRNWEKVANSHYQETVSLIVLGK